MGAAVSACTRQDPNLLNVIRRTLMCVNCKASLLNEPGPRALISRDAVRSLDHCARAGFVVRNCFWPIVARASGAKVDRSLTPLCRKPLRNSGGRRYQLAIASVKVCAAREMDPGLYLMEFFSEVPQ